MKVSVAMATYNGEKYLLEQLDSIRLQSHAVDEVVICDDGSSDNTVGLVQEYIADYHLNGWKLIQNEFNLGYANNFHKALGLVSGDIVFFCDQDDVWTRHRIERMAGQFALNDDIDVLYSEFDLFSSSSMRGKRISSPLQKRMTGDGSLERALFEPFNISIRTEGCTMAVRRSFLEEIEPYWFSGFAHDDFVWRLSLCKGSLFMLHETTLHRRIHGDNVSTSKMHEHGKRLAFLRTLKGANEAMLRYGLNLSLPDHHIELLKDGVESASMREYMISKGKPLCSIKLALKYPHCYYSLKAIPVELLMSLRQFIVGPRGE